MTEEQSKIVTNVENRPCGCRVTTYSDDSQQLQPCPPCGLMTVANHQHAAAMQMEQAAQALAATANSLRQMQSAALAAEMQDAVRRVVKP